MKLYKSLVALAMAAMTAVGFSACDNERAYPPFVEPEGGLTGDGSWENPYNVNTVIGIIKSGSEDYATSSQWVTGYIVGWVNTNISYTALSENNCIFTVPAEIGTNCLLAATPDETDYNNCVVVQLSTTGNVRSNLSLVDHPENLGKLVSLRGDVQKYFGKPGLKSTSAFSWGGEGVDDGNNNPVGDKVTFTKATTITSGKAYGIVANGKLAQPARAGNSYGYLYVEDVTISADSFTAASTNGFVFTDAGDGSWYISDSQGRFLYMEGSYTSFQLSETLAASNANYRWKAEFAADGTCTLTNAGNNNTVQYSSNYTSYGAYSSVQDGGVYPSLYLMDGEPVKLPDTSGSQTPTEPVNPPTGSVTFAKTTTLTSGATYAFVSPEGGDVCVPIVEKYTYGYLLVEAPASTDGDVITTSAANGFVITAVAGGYTIVDSFGRYMGMDGEHAGSFQLYTSAQSNNGTTWTIDFEVNGQVKMTNVLTGLTVVWKAQYNNFAPNATVDSFMPLLYIKQ